MRLFNFFNYLFNLQQIGKQKYDSMVASDCWKINPALLPPSPRAAFFHDLWVHHENVVLKDLSDVNKESLRWGWKIENSNYTLIMTDIETGPPELLRIVRLGGKGPLAPNVVVEKHQQSNPNPIKMTIKGAFLMLLNFTTFMIQQLYLYIGHA